MLMEDVSSSIILQNIRDLRQEKKYSQEYMALRLEISQNAYSKLERGITRLTLERMAQIAEILGIGMAGFFETGQVTGSGKINNGRPLEDRTGRC